MKARSQHSRISALAVVTGLLIQAWSAPALARRDGNLGPRYDDAFDQGLEAYSTGRRVHVPPSVLEAGDRPAVATAYVARIATVTTQGFHRAADDAVRASRQAALDSYRRSVRLEGPGALAQARSEATNWRMSSSRPEAADQMQKIYRGWEQKARVAAFEAAEAAYRRGYGRAKLEAQRVAKEYEGRLSRDFRMAGLRAMRRVFARGGRNVAARASAAAKAAIASAEATIAKKVAAKLVEAEKAAFAKLDTEADREAYAVYAEREKVAYGWATTTLDLDQGPLRSGVESAEARAGQVQEQVDRANEDALARGLYGM